MPYKQEYNSKTVGQGNSRTPKEVMGGEGHSVQSTVTQSAWHYQSRPTGSISFEAGTAPKKKKKY